MIDLLFKKGKSVYIYPVKLFYQFVPGEVPLQAGVAVSSRNFKKAFQRNRVKRILREAWRLQKLPLQQMLVLQNRQLVLFFVYTGKEMPVYSEVFDKMGALLQKLAATVDKKPE